MTEKQDLNHNSWTGHATWDWAHVVVPNFSKNRDNSNSNSNNNNNNNKDDTENIFLWMFDVLDIDVFCKSVVIN